MDGLGAWPAGGLLISLARGEDTQNLDEAHSPAPTYGDARQTAVVAARSTILEHAIMIAFPQRNRLLLLRSRAIPGLAAAAMFVAAQVLPSVAPAQINPFRNHETKFLTDEDLQLMSAAASKLRQSESTPIGQTETWSNPKTGSSGTVTLVQKFQRRDLPCLKLRHAVRNTAYSDTSAFDIDLCRVASGEWKVGF